MTLLENELSPLQRLIIAYAGRATQPAFEAIFAFDNRCGQIIRTTHETMLGQMRLAWWRDMLAKPASERPKGDPVLAALSGLDAGSGFLQRLIPVVDAWETLLVNENISPVQVDAYAAQRGGTLFAVIARCTEQQDASEMVVKAGVLWAKWDLARHSSDVSLRERMLADIVAEQEQLDALRLPRTLRPLSILLHLMRSDVRNGTIDEPLMRPASAARIIWHGVTGLR